jgi:hypothetical protein
VLRQNRPVQVYRPFVNVPAGRIEGRRAGRGLGQNNYDVVMVPAPTIERGPLAPLMIPPPPAWYGRQQLGALGQDFSGFDPFAGIDLSQIGTDLSSNVTAAINVGITQGISSLDSAIAHSISTSSGGKIDPVPMENYVTANVLAPVSAAVQNPAVLQSIPTLQALWNFLETGKARWLAFLQQVAINYPDGAKNSGARLAPYFSGLETNISQHLSALGSGTPFIPGTNIPSPTSTISVSGWWILAGLGLWFLSRKKGGG